MTTETKTEARERYLKQMGERMAALPLPPESDWDKPDLEWSLIPRVQAYADGNRVFLSGPDDLFFKLDTRTDEKIVEYLVRMINQEPKLVEALRREREARARAEREVERLRAPTISPSTGGHVLPEEK